MSFIAILIVASCYNPRPVGIPDKGYPDNIPDVEYVREEHTIVRQKRTSPETQLETESPPISGQASANNQLKESEPQLKSACELDVESLRSEADMWKQRYLEYQCNCGDNDDSGY
jgi:hypothetical protein